MTDEPMTAGEFRDAMILVFGSVRQGAERFEISDVAARRMAGERGQPVPRPIATWLKKTARFFAENPIPVRKPKLPDSDEGMDLHADAPAVARGGVEA